MQMMGQLEGARMGGVSQRGTGRRGGISQEEEALNAVDLSVRETLYKQG